MARCPSATTSEHEMKRIVLNRKNSLFVGNARNRRTAAILASMTSTCRRHEVDPQLYLTQLLINLPTMPISQLPRWLPYQWKKHHATSLRSLHPPSQTRKAWGSDSAHIISTLKITLVF